jgi:O-antigen ligase
MNKLTQFIFLVLFPFLPFWAWIVSFVGHTQIDVFITIIFIPIAFYILITPKINFPKYLVFFMFFTIYSVCSVYVNHLVPSYTNSLKFFFSNRNVLAFLLFFVIENTHFDESFIRIMNRNIFVIVIISLVVSLLQLRNPSFFVPQNILLDPDNETYLTEGRVFSIYSWVDLNSLGISFPILIAILLSSFSHKRMASPIIILTGIIVSFLTKARYVMISILIVFSQFFFIAKIKLSKKVSILIIFAGSILVSLGVAKAIGFNIQQVINDRILERSTNMGSANARIISYFVFLKVFPEHPIFGVGPETSFEVVRLLGGNAPLIHVGYLSYLYFYGIAGCLFLFLAIFFMLRRAWLIGTKNEFWAGFYGLIAFCFANTTMVYFNFSEMGIVLIIIYLRYYSEKPSLELSAV